MPRPASPTIPTAWPCSAVTCRSTASKSICSRSRPTKGLHIRFPGGDCRVRPALRSTTAYPSRASGLPACRYNTRASRATHPSTSRPTSGETTMSPGLAWPSSRTGKASVSPTGRRCAVGSGACGSTSTIPRCAASRTAGPGVRSVGWAAATICRIARAACTARWGSCSTACGRPNTQVSSAAVCCRRTPPNPPTFSLIFCSQRATAVQGVSCGASSAASVGQVSSNARTTTGLCSQARQRQCALARCYSLAACC